MHSCKTTRDLMTELLSDGTSPPTHELLIELRCCRECRQEFEALKETLHLTTGVIESVAPPEEYWTDYHRALKQKLLTSRAPIAPIATMSQPSWLMRVFQTSVPVPVPVGLALILLFGVALFFATRAATPKQPEAPQVVRVPVEVRVPQEKIVERIVYRDRYRRAISHKSNQNNEESILAKSRKNEVIPSSLVGFKPLEEIKLTVIKGGTGNDK